MVLMCVKAKINSYNNSEHMPACGMSWVAEIVCVDFRRHGDKTSTRSGSHTKSLQTDVAALTATDSVRSLLTSAG